MIGKRLRKSRISAGLTQQQLAEKIGISRSSIHKAYALQRNINPLYIILLT